MIVSKAKRTQNDGPLLALFPVRDGKLLSNPQSAFCMISFVQENLGIDFGRPELLACLYAACGCNGENIFTSKDKCEQCHRVFEFSKAVSCESLRLSSSSTTTIRCRSRFAIISIDEQEMEANGTWSEEIPIRAGSSLLFSISAEQSLEFKAIAIETIYTTEPLGLLPQSAERLGLLPGISNKEHAETHESHQAQQKKDPSETSDTQQSNLPSKEGTETSQPLFETQHFLSLNQPVAEKATTSHTRESREEQTKASTASKCADTASSSARANQDTSTPRKLSKPRRASSSPLPSVERKPVKLKRASSLTRPSVDFTVASSDQQFNIYMLPWGLQLNKVRIQQYEKRLTNLGAVVVKHFRQATYIVVDGAISWENLAKHPSINMGVEPLKAYLDSNNVVLPKVNWISHIQNNVLRPPSRTELWCIEIYETRKNKRKSEQTSKMEKRQKFENNFKISELFKELSEYYEACQIDVHDIWRAYSFRINAGRIIRLGFEVSDDPTSLAKLKQVTGFGKGSCLEIVEQYFRDGKVPRLEMLKTAPERVAIRNMTNIWGVGKQKATELVNNYGCKTIDDVLEKLRNKSSLPLVRNQLVGVDCYEDILERFSREEAENIGEIVRRCVYSSFPGAEVTVMGSYRRGKEDLGDVDVHITHGKHKEKIPPDALGRIVDELWKSDHIAFHLTFLYGMETGSRLEDYQKQTQIIPRSAWETSKPMGPPKNWKGEKASSSYMGVFNSPKLKGRRRRVDIKIYPYRERIFAALYFTGNGFFNRSMRLWARSFGWQLSDHGLFERDTFERVMEAENEREVFDKLKLVYKDPHERDAFDALEPIEGYFDEPAPTQEEMRENHTWID